VCTFQSAIASLTSPQTPRRGASCQGAAAPSEPYRPAKPYASARATMRTVAHRRGGLGAAVPPLGRRAGRARGVAKCCNRLPARRRGGRSCNLFQSVSILPPRPAREATLGRVAQRQPAVDRQALRALRERGEEAKSVRSEFGPCPAFVRYCSGLFGQQLRSETYGGISETF